ncbi:Uncharacterised protein [Mycobacteroides abscessus subsp. abscessus]|nr:Uncharacterised protein [Mycobacteroides abscessus subsp. abscessus]
MRAGHRAAVGEVHGHGIAGAFHLVGTRMFDQFDAALGQRILEDQRCVFVLARQHAIAAGDERHLHAEFGVGVHELGTGHTRADDDEMLRQLLEVVELAPRQDAVAIRFGVGKYPRRRARRDQHDVTVVVLRGAILQRRDDTMRRDPRVRLLQ